MNRFDQQAAQDWLAERGLPLYAAMPVANLPDGIRDQLIDGGVVLDGFPTLVLLGNAGRSFWPVLEAARPDSEHPVDDYSRATALAFARDCLDDSDAQCLFPGGGAPPLQQLGRLAGWYLQSPFGMGILPDWGLWYAYRAVLLTRRELPEQRREPVESPCLSCDAPCIAECPAQALRFDSWPESRDCLRYRITDDSPCADRCIARLACPVGAEHRYPLTQIQHHYADPLATWNRYFADSAAD